MAAKTQKRAKNRREKPLTRELAKPAADLAVVHPPS